MAEKAAKSGRAGHSAATTPEQPAAARGKPRNSSRTHTRPCRIPGVTPALADKFARLNLTTDNDLALHLPLRYEDETRITMVDDALPGVSAQFQVEVMSAEVTFRPRKQLLVRTKDASGPLLLRFLNFYPNQQQAMTAGATLRVFGEVRSGFFGEEMVHPRFNVLREDERLQAQQALPEQLTAVYPTTAGLGQTPLRRHIAAALRRLRQNNALTDTLPDELRRRLGLMDLNDALDLLHQPPATISLALIEEQTEPAWRRVRFDELLAQQISLRRAYAARRAKGAPQLRPSRQLTSALLAVLPFALTGAQQRACAEIASDLVQAHPMQRLLQGDVGSGKTIVAAMAMLQAAEAGYQAALMAPTEILAEQHYRKLALWLAPLGIQVAWLSGSQKKKDKAAMNAAIASGEALLVVGTHALIEEDVQFARLGLAIVDEQHRFGVRQRLALKQKAEYASELPGSHSGPHQLTMSATPIPRTLAMSFYADLDVSVLDELPPGRTPIKTRLVSAGRRDEVISRVLSGCLAGRQAYWVCPLIEESETLQLQTAEETYAQLCADLPELAVGLVHGRLKSDEKASVMADFVAGKVHVLVATTVIEVGVDVPNASLMVIEDAQRFGLAQLHQLRGRVGRGTAESSCILIYGHPLSDSGRQRLKIIFENSDGFEIARQDLSLRGPGEFIGARQSGMPMLRYADLEDESLINAARDAAEALLRDNPALAAAHANRWLAGAEELLKA